MVTLRQAGVLQQTGCSFQAITVHNSGLICIVLDVSVPKVVSTFRIIKGLHLRGRTQSAGCNREVA